MFDLLNRIRNFDPRNLTPAQIIVGIIVAIVVLWILGTLISIAQTLLPIALLAVVAYFGYQYLTSRSPDEAAASETVTSEAAAPAKAETKQPARSELADHADETESEAARDQAMANDVMTNARTRMEVDPVVNPETGIEEANLAQLEQKEQRLMADTKKVNDDVMAQLEERRRRLLNQQNGDDS